MTTVTHSTVAVGIGYGLYCINPILGIIGGSILGLFSHYWFDYTVFEWGFWRESKLSQKIFGGLLLGFLSIIGVLISILIFQNSSWLLLIPFIYGGLPDYYDGPRGMLDRLLKRIPQPYYFWGHKNVQTWDETLSFYKTFFVEGFLILATFIVTIVMFFCNLPFSYAVGIVLLYIFLLMLISSKLGTKS